MPPEHLRRLTGAAIPSIVPLRKKVPVLPPKYIRREGGYLNDEERLVQGWNFVPWVAPISSLPLASEKEEEEDEMADLIHKFNARKLKQGANFKRTTGVAPEVMGEADQHSANGGSEEQEIVIMDSPEMGFHGQPVVKTAHLAYLGEVPLTHKEARGGIPSKQTANRPAKAISSRARHSRSLLLDRLLLYSYIPP